MLSTDESKVANSRCLSTVFLYCMLFVFAISVPLRRRCPNRLFRTRLCIKQLHWSVHVRQHSSVSIFLGTLLWSDRIDPAVCLPPSTNDAHGQLDRHIFGVSAAPACQYRSVHPVDIRSDCRICDGVHFSNNGAVGVRG